MIWKSIHGINLWKINRSFTKLALSRISIEEELKGRKITIKLNPVYSTSYSSDQVKKEIEEAINELEGYETFKLCIFKKSTIVYKEQLFTTSLSRWIEIIVDEPVEKRLIS